MPSLYRKWRPRTWEQILGQDAVVRTLQQAVRSGRVAHAYLFAGPRGTGKTTTARVLAKALNCLDPNPDARPCDQCAHCQAINEGRFLDLIEIDAASHTGVDDVRALRETVHFAPTQGRFKVYIIDEVHMLSTAAFNALLKTLEEPPEHVVFVLATTEWHKVPATVRSRCQVFPFRRIPMGTIVQALKGIVEAEGLQAEDAALRAIARHAGGSLRDALSLLDQLAAFTEAITLEHVQTLLGTAPDEAVYHIVEALRQGQAEAALREMARAMEQGTEPRVLARQLVDYLRQVLLTQMNAEDLLDLGEGWRERLREHARTLRPETLLRWIRLFQRAATALSASWYPSLPLELALVEALYEEEPDRPAGTPRGPSFSPKPPPPKAELRPAPAQPGQPALDFATVQRAWPQVRQWLKQHAAARGAPDLPGLVDRVRVVQVEGPRIVLAAAGEAYRKRFLQSPYRELWLEAWQTALGRPVEILWQTARPTGFSAEKASPLVEKVIQLGGQIQQYVPSEPESGAGPRIREG